MKSSAVQKPPWGRRQHYRKGEERVGKGDQEYFCVCVCLCGEGGGWCFVMEGNDGCGGFQAMVIVLLATWWWRWWWRWRAWWMWWRWGCKTTRYCNIPVWGDPIKTGPVERDALSPALFCILCHLHVTTCNTKNVRMHRHLPKKKCSWKPRALVHVSRVAMFLSCIYVMQPWIWRRKYS